MGEQSRLHRLLLRDGSGVGGALDFEGEPRGAEAIGARKIHIGGVALNLF